MKKSLCIIFLFIGHFFVSTGHFVEDESSV